MSQPHARRLRRRRLRLTRGAARGQSLIELALALPLLLVMLLGVADFARLLAVAVAAQGAAKQAAVLAARHYVSPVSCLRRQAQQLVDDDMSGRGGASVALSESTPVTQTYPGEVDVQATVSYSFTLIAPGLFGGIGAAAHPIVARAAAVDPVMPVTGADPATTAQGITATRNISDSGSYADAIGWTMPLTWTPPTVTDPASGQVYTTTFRVLQSLDPTGASLWPACPVGAAIPAVATPGYHYLWTHATDPSTPQRYQYAVAVYGPALPPLRGYPGAPQAAPTP